MTPSDRLLQHPVRLAELGGGVRVAYREAGPAATVTHVLLHGIGSASGSWVFQLAAAQAHPAVRVLAWDAPGYGDSTPLVPVAPDATDYATRLWAWLDALDVRTPVTLVGHSLGALMVARAALLRPGRVQRLLLLAPARGYGQAPAAERAEKLGGRLALLARLGPQGMAQARGAAMLSPAAPTALVDAVRETMARVHVGGYTQAARLLDQGDLLADLQQVKCPVQVASGSADTITPPAACQAVARSVGQDRHDLGPVGHACPLEAADAVNALTGLVPLQPAE
ncbi:alpha/beta fold hydrolase [Hydrogenophaga sp.]|uniref:alpha/beta fold hydrolase n=1 Tax=Hydrogenophaga sp. TaxID=1904254 RepID=UPI00286DC1F1|nr:alpha/beta fold hydrolase [Hydrogenophaga sp.]